MAIAPTCQANAAYVATLSDSEAPLRHEPERQTRASAPETDMFVRAVRDAKGGDEPLYTFGVFADAQYCDADTEKGLGVHRNFRGALARTKEAIAAFNTAGVNAIFMLGDLIDHQEQSYEAMAKVLQGAKAPILNVAGNHDYSEVPAKDYGAKVAIPRGRVMQHLGGLETSKGYYGFSEAGVRYLFLDGTEVSTYANADGTPKHEQAERIMAPKSTWEKMKRAMTPLKLQVLLGWNQALAFNGAIGEEQMRWLRTNLAEAKAAGEKVIFSDHFPVWAKKPHSVMQGHNLWNSREVQALFEEYEGTVALVLSGHNHEGGFGVDPKTKIPHLVAPGAVESADTNAFAIVKVHKDRIEVEGSGRFPSRTITLAHPIDPEAGTKTPLPEDALVIEARR